jgi:hypothetical protein
MWKFVTADKAHCALSAETNFHIQKYDGLENIENPSRGLEVKLSSVPYSVFLMFGFCMGDPHTNLK